MKKTDGYLKKRIEKGQGMQREKNNKATNSHLIYFGNGT